MDDDEYIIIDDDTPASVPIRRASGSGEYKIEDDCSKRPRKRASVICFKIDLNERYDDAKRPKVVRPRRSDKERSPIRGRPCLLSEV